MTILTKREIRNRLHTTQTWVTQTRTDLLVKAGGTGAVIPERQIEYIVAIHINGNRTATNDLTVEKMLEDGTYEVKIGPVPVAQADRRQIPEGSFDLEDNILKLEGGTRLYGRTDGNSLSVTTWHWRNIIQ